MTLRTECCNAYDTYWDDLHVCRACHKPNPTMVERQECRPPPNESTSSKIVRAQNIHSRRVEK